VPARAIERKHELCDEALTVRVLRGERLQLPDRLLVLTEGELGVEAHLVGAQPELLEPFGFGATGRREGDVRERRPPPQGKRSGG